jgi:hypothetical protein
MSGSDYIATNYCIIAITDLVRMLKEAFIAHFKYSLGICLERLSETKKSFGQYIRFPVRDSIWVPVEHKSEALPFKPAYSVSHSD